MDFLLVRGSDFQERFDFKNESGRSIVLPAGEYKIIVQRGDFAREYTVGQGLSRTRTAITWRITAQQTQDFDYRTLYYTLYVGDRELVRGVLKVQ